MSKSYYDLFAKQQYEIIKAELRSVRISHFYRGLESKKNVKKGTIFPFARGLRFAALLTKYIRERLDGSSLSVCWGQIINEEGNLLSGECDIIIYSGGFEKRWNGENDNEHIMDFRFISQENVKSVLSCKSFIDKSSLLAEKKYCEDLLNYVDKIWMFAECCGPRSEKKLKELADELGCEKFWVLYRWNRKFDTIIDNLVGWNDFSKTLKMLKDNYKSSD